MDIKERIAALEAEHDELRDELQRQTEEIDATLRWTEEQWAAYRAEADAYFEALDGGFPGGAPDRPAPLPPARAVKRGWRGWLADLCHRTSDKGD